MADIEPEIRAIIVAGLGGDADEEEMRRLDEWRGSSLDNERAYRRWARVWAVSGQFIGDAANATPPSASAIIQLAEARSGRWREAVGRSGSTRRRHVVAAAAILVLGVGLGAIVTMMGRDTPLQPRLVATGGGEVATATLGDGTVVHLAPNSRLEFSSERGEREVRLYGRAYFAVTSDPSRPFRVRLPGGLVEVLGTRFDVDDRGEGLQVAVVEGVVEMESGGRRARVEANQLGVARADDVPTVQEVEDVFEWIGWLGTFLAFESTPVSEVALELERRFGMRIEVTEGELEERTVTGWFGDQSPRDLLLGICAAVAAQCSIDQDRATMRPGS